MTITGLNSDLYYSDNPIYVTVTGLGTNTNYIEYFSVSSDVGINPIKLYANGRTSLTFDISPFIKISIPNVPHNTNYSTLTPFVVANNWIKQSFVFKQVLNNGLTTQQTLTKTFIKGGKRTYDSNTNTSTNKPLVPVATIPQWGGFPIDYYYMNTAKQMVKSNVIPSAIKDVKKIKGCDPLYVKFKNSLGGIHIGYLKIGKRKRKPKTWGLLMATVHFQIWGTNWRIRLQQHRKCQRNIFQ